MKIVKTQFKGLKIIETDVFGDSRGWFTETYTKNKFIDNDINIEFIQDNQSYSAHKGTLRGIHFQTNPSAQTKLIRCTRGEIIDTVIDLRKGSDTYKKYYSIELSAKNKKQLLIPKGFGHAFLTITDNVEVQYKVDEYFSKDNDRSIRYDDPEIGIEWGIENPILSEKDLKAPFFRDINIDFSIKVLVTGVAGQLGHDVVKRLNELNIKNMGVDIKDFNICDEQQSEEFIMNYNPDVIIHCAAYTAVDKAENDREKCFEINTIGTKNIAKLCKKIDAKMVYISTDYVFDGEGEEPYLECDKTNPINYYGYSKEQGEIIIKDILDKYFIIRTSWVYGRNGNNFINTIVNLAKVKKELNIINDQIGSPTYTIDLAVFICNLIQTTKYGIYHVTNEGYCSWYDFALLILDLANIEIKVNPIMSIEYCTNAKRPLNSRLAKSKLNQEGFSPLPDWKDALKRYFKL